MLKQLTLLALVLLSGCDGLDTSDSIQDAKQEQLNAQAVQSVGMPGIIRFSEKRQLKAIYELRDEAVSTITYIVDLQGHTHKLCDSVGFGIPYTTEYTSPQKKEYYGSSGIAALPQADPNGLYSPQAAEGTWVLCLDPKTKHVSPLYVEPRIIVSQFALSL